MEHTPGPWKVESGAVYTKDGKPIARMVRDTTAYNAGIMPVERDTNAHFIATAPDLEKALSLCYTRLFNYQAGMDGIRNPQATKKLNEEALSVAKSALDTARDAND